MSNPEFELFDFKHLDNMSVRSEDQPLIQLLHALKEQNLEKFTEILRSIRETKIHVNHVFDRYNASILEIACSFPNFPQRREFVEALINYGAKINSENFILGKSPLHLAVKFSDSDTIRLLLENNITKVNIRDSDGNTALHEASQLNKIEIVDLLLQHPDIEVDAVNNDKQTSLDLAIAKGNQGTILKFIEHKRIDVNGDDGKYTYLQYACDMGLSDVVEGLLKNGADPNLSLHQHQPIIIAARRGVLEIIEMLVKHGNIIYDSTDEGTVLHVILNSMTKGYTELESRVSSEIFNYVECLEYLLNNVSPDLLNINAANENGQTALHLAVKWLDKYIIRLLLDRGAYVGLRNNQGEMPITLIDAEVFKEYLDDCVVTNEKRPFQDDYAIIFKYNFLKPPNEALASKAATPFELSKGEVVVLETEPLIELSRIPELRHLLKHPVLASFLHLKWFAIRKYVWFNFSVYILFLLSLTGYVWAVHSIDRNDVEEKLVKSRTILWCLTIFFWFLLLIREVFQFKVSPKRYLHELENFLEIALLVSVALILFRKVDSEYAAVAILLAWMELVLLIGRHPWLSTNIEMFKVVCISFIKMLAWYWIIILAFAMSFYLLFKNAKKSICTSTRNVTDATKENNASVSLKNESTISDNVQFLENLGVSIFKAVIPLIDEIPSKCHPGISHILFLLFVFLIAIVLFNLLNGLTVCDTLAIRSQAEIVGNECRAKLSAYLEQMAIGDPLLNINIFDKLTCMCCRVPSPPQRRSRFRSRYIELFYWYEHINLFPGMLPNDCARVLMNKGSLVCTKCLDKIFYSDCGEYCGWYMKRNIMKLAKEILVERNTRNEEAKELKQYQEELALLKETCKSTENKLNEVIELLKKRQ